jgi:very-short-patch-repair endonuclease
MKTNIIVKARQLRSRMTDAERKLWQILRGRRLGGYRFRKQAPLGKYVADFICHEAKLIIEVDGGHHNESKEANYDARRTSWLNSQGYIVHRFWNNEVLGQLEAVSGIILELCFKRYPPILSFPHKKRGEGTI